MLQLRSFVPTQDKVKTLEFHPVQPWIAFADKADNVKVWDWSTQQVVHDLSLGGADDEGAVEAAINRGGERDGSFATNASAAGYVPSRVASGHVRQVRFLDAEVAHWQSAAAALAVNGTAAVQLLRASDVHALDGARLLVIVCEAKVLLYDLASKKPFEVTKATLDGKSPTCVAFLFRGGPGGPVSGGAGVDGMMASPLLAVGCADGVVRLVHLATLRVVGRLAPSAGAKSGAITAVLALPSRAGYEGGGAAAGSTGGGRQQQRQQKQQQQHGPDLLAGGGAAAGQFVASRDLVVAGDSAGALLLWDPFSRLAGRGGDTAPARTVEGHSGEVLALCLAPGPEDPVATAPRVFSAGADKQLAAWEPQSLTEMWRTKMDPKAPATSLAYSHRYFNLSGAHALLMTVGGSAVMAMYTLAQLPLERGLRPCVDLAPLIPPGTKKVPKAYAIAVSPMRPNLAAVGANAGLAFLTFDRMYPLPVAPVPPRDLAAAHVSPGRAPAPAGAPHAAYAAHMGDAVWLVTCAAVSKDFGDGTTHTLPSVLSRERVGPATGQSGRAIIAVSPSGQYVSACWPASRQYFVWYRTLTGAWQQVDSGLGVDLAWHSHRDQFAVVEEPPPQMPHLPKAKGLLKNREKEAARAAAAAAEAAAAAALQSVLRIRQLDGLEVKLTCQQASLGGDVPVGVHGGPLLGVSYRRVTSSGAELSGEEASPVMQLWSWDGRTKVGPEFPEPNFVRWDPTVHMVALGYLRQVQLFRARPAFEHLATVPVPGATGAAWALRQLYIATTTSVHAAFVSPGESRGPAGQSLLDLDDGAGGGGPAEPVVALVTLAATSGSDAVGGLRAEGAASGGAALPAPAPRPPGPIALLGAAEGGLWLVNSYGQPMVLPLTHPGVRARCLASMGDVMGAVQVAAAGLAPRHHNDFASFLGAMAGPTGAHMALLGLPGLSLPMEVELCIATGQWRRALACCDALIHGCADRSHLRFAGNAAARRYAVATEASAAAAEAVATGAGAIAAAAAAASAAAAGAAAAADSVAQTGPRADDPPAPTKAATNQAMWGHMGFGGLFVDNFSTPVVEEPAQRKARDPIARGRVDWGAPLGGGWKYARGGGGRATHTKPGTAGAAAGGPAPGALPPSRDALRLAMRLVEGSHGAGVTDVTAAAAALLLEHRGCLSAAQLARLAARMAEVGMNDDVRLLVDSSVRSGSHNGQAVGFVAAALTGDLGRLQSALATSGTVALAALQANTYRLPQSMATMTAWNDALCGASAAGGGQAHLTVTPAGL
ncbi:hypothetical protein Rsub_01336 [Raphidocelis subcapitata]|uniref:Uncharacterized protein n=1 Tax=Raphidocelis subcapitata TaxID=307507 RepID=A0A2V0NMA6_9CHLO|nr:hypothetical protein Rsub_01336 [Raphidocelis subcapitata]|eukprot:GBF88621.1 hypothetical protein Rsub_01336 [Raphidocelis subcapitata]